MGPERSDDDFELHDGFCAGYHQGVELIGKRWNGVILREMLLGATRFSEISQRVPGLTDKMLSARLRELDAAGVVARVVHPETPVRVEYLLTDMGRDLHDAVSALNRWSSRWIQPDDAGGLAG